MSSDQAAASGAVGDDEDVPVAPAAPATADQPADHAATPALADELPDDYFVRLWPLSIDLLEEQVRRVGLVYTRTDGPALELPWPDFGVVIVVRDSTVDVRVLLDFTFVASELTSLVGRCNAWNDERSVLKASAAVVVAPASEEAGAEPTMFAQVRLSYALSCEAGVAPVQLQSVLRSLPDEVRSFIRSTAIADFLKERALSR